MANGRIPPLALYMTSSFMPEKGAQLERFVSSIRRFGWNEKKLQSLMKDFQLTIRNFEKLLAGGTKMRVTCYGDIPGMKEEILLIEGNQIAVNLRHGPEKILGFGPRGLSYLMIEMLLQNDLLQKTALMVNNIMDTSIIEYGVDSIVNFYVNERGTTLGVSEMRAFCLEIIENTGWDMIKRKLSYFLLRPHAFNSREIEDTINAMCAEIRETTAKKVLGIDEFQTWNTIAQLAIFATLAKKLGNMPAYMKCHDLLYGAIARTMSWIEFAQIEVSEKEEISNSSYPGEAEAKINMTVKGYRLLFNNFQRIAEFFYDNVN